MSGRVGTECTEFNRALCGFASHGQFGIWLGVPVALGLITPSFALPQQLPPGISHYEVEILGGSSGLVHNVRNTAWDLSDCGVVVGRAQQLGGMQPFAWSRQDSPFGLHAGEWNWLPNNDFLNAEAYDINEHGVVVGVLGSVLGVGPSNSTRGAIWRLLAGPSPQQNGNTLQAVAPPPTWPGLSAADGGFLIFEAVSAELPALVVGQARVHAACLGGGPGSGGGIRTGVIVYDVATAQFWTEPSTAEYSDPPAPHRRGLGISRTQQIIVGSSPPCGETAGSCYGACGATRWTLGGSPAATLEALDILTSAGSGTGPISAEIRAVTDDGVAAGYAMDQISGGCTSQAHVWSNVNSSSSARLRLPPSGVISRADDIERALWTAGHCVVGFVEPQVDPPYGALWFRQDGPFSASSTWSVTDVNDMISPGCGVHIQSLRGVNQWGDCVGAAIANGDGVLRPVVLRAVRCVGDLDHSGSVNAADISILLGTWGCADGCCPIPAADLNLDGAVNATDLALLLSRWGVSCTSGPACAGASISVPEPLAADAKATVELSISVIGLTDIEGYKAWAATVPETLREIVDEMIWEAIQGGQ